MSVICLCFSLFGMNYSTRDPVHCRDFPVDALDKVTRKPWTDRGNLLVSSLHVMNKLVRHRVDQ